MKDNKQPRVKKSPTIPRSDIAEMVEKQGLELLEQWPYYFNTKQPVKVRCLECGAVSMKRPRNAHRNKTGCPACAERVSKGAIAIKEYLVAHNIPHEVEFRIKGCRDKSPLPFDFAVLNGEQPVFLIEFDGLQHYQAIDHFGGEETFIGQQRRDAIKTQFCLDNNIPLLRIKYTNLKKIPNILNKALAPYLNLQ